MFVALRSSLKPEISQNTAWHQLLCQCLERPIPSLRTTSRSGRVYCPHVGILLLRPEIPPVGV
jgi:hypothetical protein